MGFTISASMLLLGWPLEGSERAKGWSSHDGASISPLGELEVLERQMVVKWPDVVGEGVAVGHLERLLALARAEQNREGIRESRVLCWRGELEACQSAQQKL